MKPVPRSYGVSGELKPVKPNSYGVVNMVSVLVSVVDPLPLMSLLQSQLRLEAEVGIGRLMPVFQGKTTPLSALFQYNLALFGLTCFNPITEDFIEGFWRLLLRESNPYSLPFCENR
jgi:hypothetical protein